MRLLQTFVLPTVRVAVLNSAACHHYGSAVLEPLGLTELEEVVYLRLVSGRASTMHELCLDLGTPRSQIRSAVARLRELGFVSHGPGVPDRLTAVRPDLAVGSLVARRTQEFLDVQRIAQQLASDFPEESRTHPEDLVEVVSGRQAVATRFTQLGQSTEKEMLVLDRPPYAQVVTEPNASEVDALSRGSVVRGIYAPEAFEVPGAFADAMRSVADGEQARVHADVPMKLLVVDQSVAMLPMTSSGGVDSALVVHAPMVVAALVELFELLWRQACPLPDWRPDAAMDDGVDGELMALLATGMKDEAIARELGISVRTLGRRIAGLLEAVGARTRYQAGLQAARRDS